MFEGVIVIKVKCLGRAAGDHVVDNTLAAFLCNICFLLILTCFHFITQGTDNRHICTMNKVHTVIGTT